MKPIRVALLLVSICSLAAAQTELRGQRAMIISLDGARPDAVLRADTPNIRKLLAEGSFSFWARTTEESITLPSHASMVTGVPPKRHGITWNGDKPVEEITYSPYPTLFQLAKSAGLTTALVAGKSKFIALAPPGSVDWLDVPPAGSGAGDAKVAASAASIIREHRPQVMMVHMGDGDGAAHSEGWGSPRHIKTIEASDRAVGQVLDALRAAGVYDQTLIILSADHGGAGTHHGPDDPRSRHIPWICVGPGVRKGVDLTLYPELVINTEDTFATAAAFLGLSVRPDITGKPIRLIAEQPPADESPAAASPATQPAAAAGK